MTLALADWGQNAKHEINETSLAALTAAFDSRVICGLPNVITSGQMTSEAYKNAGPCI